MSKRTSGPASARSYEAFLATLTGAYSEPEQVCYLTSRWYDRLKKAHRIADKNKSRYYVIRIGVLVATASLPFLVTWQTTGTRSLGAFPGWVAAVLSVVAAALTGLLEILKPGERWRLYRQLRHDLERAGWNLLNDWEGCAHPDAHRERFSCFVTTVEQFMSNYSSEYFAGVALLVPQVRESEGLALTSDGRRSTVGAG